MLVVSTRNPAAPIPALQAVLEGIAEDGGLFVPGSFPALDAAALAQDAKAGYHHVAARILALFFAVPHATLLSLAQDAYAGFTHPAVAPIHTLPDGAGVMELFHGPTLAFKDMALQILPRLMRLALDASGRKDDALILTATSGDTGKAALEGFRDVPRTSVFVFYPADGVAEMQRLQMVTQAGKNVGVAAIRGNFDDAQTGVKRLFADAGFKARVQAAGRFLSSANSINIGRLIPQVAYYVNSYLALLADGTLGPGDGINFVVPTGNFGNILAAYYAKRMGLPIRRLVCASNRNNVLTDFFRQGKYDARRPFHKTMSPSMDILVSSNLERLLFELCGRDAEAVSGWMRRLGEDGSYEIPAGARERLEADFHADFCTDEETSAAIRATWEEAGYLMDPHTAVAMAAWRKYRAASGDTTRTVVVSTASPFKFAPDVLQALTGETVADAFLATDKLSALTGLAVPRGIMALRNLPERHTGVVDKDGLGAAVEAFL